ncbi:MAG: YceI family protein [Bacteroidota bacterium]
MMKKICLFAFTFLIFVSISHAQNINWVIQDGYEIKFSGSGADGTFGNLTGIITFDKDNLGDAQFNVTLAANTISTGNKTKDKHARGDNWFDVEKFPKIKFTSTRVSTLGDDYQIVGELELHGVKKQITFPFTFTENGNKGIFEGTFTVNREDFDIMGPFFGFVVGDEFEVTVKVPVQQ